MFFFVEKNDRCSLFLSRIETVAVDDDITLCQATCPGIFTMRVISKPSCKCFSFSNAKKVHLFRNFSFANVYS